MIYSLNQVSRTYTGRSGEVPAVSGLTFTVQSGEIVALIGPSGAGKTTLFRLLNGTLRSSGGTLRFDGRDVSAMGARELRSMRRRIGTIYQLHHLVPSLSALQNTLCGRLGYWSLAHTIRTALKPGREETGRAMAALESVGLSDKRNARADELSGGQQQRLTIARVLMQDPDVILADEPFASLDPTLTESVAALLLGLVQDQKRTLISTLHDVSLAQRYFPRMIALREGQLVFDLDTGNVSREALYALYASEISPAELDSDESGLNGRSIPATTCAPGCPR